MRVSIGRILPLTCLLESKTEKTNLVPVNVSSLLPSFPMAEEESRYCPVLRFQGASPDAGKCGFVGIVWGRRDRKRYGRVDGWIGCHPTVVTRHTSIASRTMHGSVHACLIYPLATWSVTRMRCQAVHVSTKACRMCKDE
jgi:hypothetical protein